MISVRIGAVIVSHEFTNHGHRRNYQSKVPAYPTTVSSIYSVTVNQYCNMHGVESSPVDSLVELFR